VLQCCPVGAIERAVPIPESPAEKLAPEIVSGWEAAWEAHRHDPEDLPERERRYGRLFHVAKLDGCHILSIELPRRLPAYDVLFMYGIPLERPEYNCSLHRLNPRTWSVRAMLSDARLRHLSGKLNSFPTGFKVDYGFPEPIGGAYLRPRPRRSARLRPARRHARTPCPPRCRHSSALVRVVDRTFTF
jgi:hypothetical protein